MSRWSRLGGSLRQPGAGLLKAAPLVEVFVSPGCVGVPCQQFTCDRTGGRHVGREEAGQPGKVLPASSDPMQTTGRWRWRPMTTAMSRNGTPTSAPIVLLIWRPGRRGTTPTRAEATAPVCGHRNRQLLARDGGAVERGHQRQPAARLTAGSIRHRDSSLAGHRQSCPFTVTGPVARLRSGRAPSGWRTRGSPASWWRRVRRPRRAQTRSARVAGIT